jgi:hypothetical protein
MASWILAVFLCFNLIFVNLFALKSISLVILYSVHENHLHLNLNHSESQTQSLSTQVPVPSTFMRTRHLEYFWAKRVGGTDNILNKTLA